MMNNKEEIPMPTGAKTEPPAQSDREEPPMTAAKVEKKVAQHTPQWRVVAHSWQDTGIYEGAVRIALLQIEDCESEDYLAKECAQGQRATLIAAAPDMLAALEAFRMPEESIVGAQAGNLILRVPTNVIAQMAAAVRKATGAA